jgi:hypothetical protein
MSEVRVEARAPRFFDLYSRGEVIPDHIHDFIGRWHDDQEPWARDMPLDEYLGLTHDEYEVGLHDPFSLPCRPDNRAATWRTSWRSAMRNCALPIVEKTAPSSFRWATG